jgi:hypothetical protein
MKLVKITFIAVEIACLIGVIVLSFVEMTTDDGQFFKAAYTSLFALLAVIMQREQQNIEWNDED